MAADRALAEDDQAARQDVRAFDRDRDRHHLVAAREVVLRAEHDALAAVHVHRVVGDLAAELGEWYFSIADGTEGFSPPSMAPAVTERAASMM